ncbi:MAG: metallophosphoesterase [Candidatus Magnetominusculus sp. LBB02]|nr:metallophosphoesterase [Candidatus Magnetominusculus sp. LBB02]
MTEKKHDIRYVCLSDMHLGDEGSILTALEPGTTKVDTSQAAACLRSLVECMREAIGHNSAGAPKPTLILNGDTLEMALSTTDVAATVFMQFIELVFEGSPLFDRIIYIPGNHDHHIWESARETQYVEYIKRLNLQCGEALPPQWHTTNMFERDEHVSKKPKKDGDHKKDRGFPESYLLNNVIKGCRGVPKDFSFEISYPNFAIKDEFNHVVFHHGHFIEWTYKFISYLKEIVFPGQRFPKNIWTLEGENFAWIDFIWSALGQSGKAGKDVGKVYRTFASKLRLKRLFEPMIRNLVEKIDEIAAPELLLGIIPLFVVNKAVEKCALEFMCWLKNTVIDILPTRERLCSTAVLSDLGRTGLIKYLAVQIHNQILAEKVKAPTDIKFVFGHTHSPFCEHMDVYSDKYDNNRPKNYPENYPHIFEVYNTGGWVVDTIEDDPRHGGSVVFVDDELNVASVKIYKEGDYKPEVHTEYQNALTHKIEQIIKGSKKWHECSKEAGKAVQIRREVLEDLI